MSTRLFGAKKESRILVHELSLALLLSLAMLLCGSAGFTSEGLASVVVERSPSEQDGLDARVDAPEESESKVKEATPGCPLDSDVLDMEGDWNLTYGYGFPGLTSDGAGHYIPTGYTVTYGVRLMREERTTYGYKFSGAITYAPYPVGGLGATIQGETFYDGRGVHVVQMRLEDGSASGRYFQILAGSHQPYLGETRVEIKGGWADVGPAGCGTLTGAYRQTASFVMVKVR